jgi:hypothetical protein
MGRARRLSGCKRPKEDNVHALSHRRGAVCAIAALAAAGLMLALALVVAPLGEGASKRKQFRPPIGSITRVAWTVDGQETSGTSFERIGLFLPSCGVIARGPISATLSIQLRGAPVDVRVRVRRKGQRARVLEPGVVRFDPGSGPNSSSFTFVGYLQRPTGKSGLDFQAEWRSPTGETASLEKASLRSSLRHVGPCDPRD